MKEYVKPETTTHCIEMETYMSAISGEVDGPIGVKPRIEEDMDLIIQEEENNATWGHLW